MRLSFAHSLSLSGNVQPSFSIRYRTSCSDNDICSYRNRCFLSSYRTASNALEPFGRICCDGFFAFFMDIAIDWKIAKGYESFCKCFIYCEQRLMAKNPKKREPFKVIWCSRNRKKNTDLCLCHRWSWKRNIVYSNDHFRKFVALRVFMQH